MNSTMKGLSQSAAFHDGVRACSAAAIGLIKLGSLFLTLPTRVLTGWHVIAFEGYDATSEFELARVRRLLSEPVRVGIPRPPGVWRWPCSDFRRSMLSFS